MKAHASPGRARERIGSPGRDRRSCYQNSPGIAAPVHPLVRDVNFKWILNSRSVFLVKRNRGRWQQAPRSTRSLARRMSRSLSDALGALSRALLRSVFYSDATSLPAKCVAIAEHCAPNPTGGNESDTPLDLSRAPRAECIVCIPVDPGSNPGQLA